ncbi:T9SS type A sorting domain-containing protein [Cytophagaceae bacterium DM2B3-1]|uniref:T9SS type A sorting domain-containing protein n=1 Tax=Xanthocytophaga flava TaxID=3048013 RepID=A0ABT7CCI3_9BACT|nr:T9SS type A sorting domain-containing protein [Xanthocytophaga flavus]MDJ1470032.1 T9SS type A sorting domain-containing protein [Xanthocytophaga flavus]MDJ1491404.1 T9SS type A sorting domain-containing protein [Xanthocytophaga flavus]
MKATSTISNIWAKGAIQLGLSLVVILFSLFDVQAQQCTSGCNRSLDVGNNPNGTLQVDLNPSVTSQTICLNGSGTFLGTIDLGSRNNVTLCIGQNVNFADQARIVRAGGSNLTINNYGRVTLVRITNNLIYVGAPLAFLPTGITLGNNFTIRNYNIFDFGGPSVWIDLSLSSSNITNQTNTASMSIYGNLTINNSSSVTNLGNFSVLQTNFGIPVAGTGDLTLNNNASLTHTGVSFTIADDYQMNGNGTILTVSGTQFTVLDDYTQTNGTARSINNPLLPGGGCGTIRVLGESTINGGVFGANNTLLGMYDNLNTPTGFDNVGGSATVTATGRIKNGCVVALPVTFVYVRGAYTEGQVKINWATASEENNDYFTVERSTDGKEFTPIATIDGAGNSSDVLSYQFVDPSPAEGVAYYRVKQTDFDEKFAYSRVVSINKGAVATLSRVFPNPVSHADYVQVTITDEKGGDIFVTVYDRIGKQCYAGKFSTGTIPSVAVKDFYSVSGMYILEARQGDSVIREKIVVQ